MMTDTLFDKIDTTDVRNRALTRPAPPATVTAFLGRLSLLHGVPFSYLVADEKLLPPESLKLFHIDPQWINALLGGALSVGGSETIRLLLNKADAGTYIADILADARQKRAQPSDDGRFRAQAGGPPAGSTPSFSFSGFLLRSKLLQAWPGVEVRALGVATEAGQAPLMLEMLRLDRIAPDTLFALVGGKVAAIEITQPAEGLHFAIDTAAPPMRTNGAARVLDIGQLTKHSGSSAEFAKRYMSHQLRFVFRIGG